MITLFTYLIVLNKKIEYRSNAYRILDSKIEEYRNSSFDGLSSNSTSVSNLPPGNSVATNVTNNIEGSTQTDIKLVTVTVSWNFKGQQIARISSYITRGGIQR